MYCNYTVWSYSDILVREEVIGVGLGGLGEQGVRLRALVMAIAEGEQHMKYDVHVQVMITVFCPHWSAVVITDLHSAASNQYSALPDHYEDRD